MNKRIGKIIDVDFGFYKIDDIDDFGLMVTVGEIKYDSSGWYVCVPMTCNRVDGDYKDMTIKIRDLLEDVGVETVDDLIGFDVEVTLDGDEFVDMDILVDKF